MRHGRLAELPDPAQLPEDHLIEDATFAFPGVPETITLAIAFGVFTHLPHADLATALTNLRRFPNLRATLFTVFLSDAPTSTRQPDGVVTHPDRPPYHRPGSPGRRHHRAPQASPPPACPRSSPAARSSGPPPDGFPHLAPPPRRTPTLP